MLELYQFELSQYSEKVRLILDYKGLEYRKIEVTPGIGQVELFQKTGQRQVPVLKDGSKIEVRIPIIDTTTSNSISVNFLNDLTHNSRCLVNIPF